MKKSPRGKCDGDTSVLEELAVCCVLHWSALSLISDVRQMRWSPALTPKLVPVWRVTAPCRSGTEGHLIIQPGTRFTLSRPVPPSKSLITARRLTGNPAFLVVRAASRVWQRALGSARCERNDLKQNKDRDADISIFRMLNFYSHSSIYIIYQYTCMFVWTLVNTYVH